MCNRQGSMVLCNSDRDSDLRIAYLGVNKIVMTANKQNLD